VARPSKLKRFAEMREFQHVFEPDGQVIMREDYEMKGHWFEQFFKNHAPITLELGCGKGEYTVGLASRYPNRNFIGIDIKGARMWKGATAALHHGLSNVAFVRTKIDFVHRIFASGEIEEIWVTFPDPQPKKPKKRLVSSFFLTQYQAILKAGGKIHLKTDSRLLHEYLKALLAANQVEPEVCTNDLYKAGFDEEELGLKTFYEERFLAEGKPITYISFVLPAGNRLIEPDNFNQSEWDG